LEIPDFQGWLTRNDATKNAYCLVCKRDIKGSMTMMRRHAYTGKHIDNMTNFGGELKAIMPATEKVQPIRYMIEGGESGGEAQVVVVHENGSVLPSEYTQAGVQIESEQFSSAVEEEFTPVDTGEVYVTICRSESFSASHRLHSSEMTAFKNQEIFGKCNSPNGHGHNYKFDVGITGPIDKTTGMVMNISELKKLIQSNVLDLVDHKNLDKDVPYFRNTVSTAENIAIFIWRQLRHVIDTKLHIQITVYETDKNKAIFPAVI